MTCEQFECGSISNLHHWIDNKNVGISNTLQKGLLDCPGSKLHNSSALSNCEAI